jgi:hypothetical protein
LGLEGIESLEGLDGLYGLGLGQELLFRYGKII